MNAKERILSDPDYQKDFQSYVLESTYAERKQLLRLTADLKGLEGEAKTEQEREIKEVQMTIARMTQVAPAIYAGQIVLIEKAIAQACEGLGVNE